MNDKTILLVEDNQDDIDLTLRALKKNGILNEVLIARDGVDALSHLFDTSSDKSHWNERRPCIVLLDLKLPKMDGFQVLAKIRSDQRTRYLPVIILTSSKEERDLIEGYKCGANSYIRKPVDYEEFVEAVQRISTYWMELNEVPASSGEN